MVEGEHGDKPWFRWELWRLPVSAYTSSISSSTRLVSTDGGASAAATKPVCEAGESGGGVFID